MAVLNRICHETPRPLRDVQSDLPDWFEKLVQRLLQKDPQHRFATATRAADVLAQCLAHLQQPANVPLPPELLPANSEADPPERREDKPSRWFAPAVSAMITIGGLLLLAMIPGWLKPTVTNQLVAPPALAPATSPVPLEWHDQFDTEIVGLEEQLRQLEADRDEFPDS